MYQVRGKLLYKDGTVPKAAQCMVHLQPAKDSTAEIRKGAAAGVLEDGSFELYTRRPGDGVHAGEYDAYFSVRNSLSETASPLIARKYEQPSTSGYNNIKVDHNIYDLTFEIERAAGGASK
jgi:hypothetical protein